MHELTPVRASLEDAFMELTSDTVEYRSDAATAAGPRHRVLKGHAMTLATTTLDTPRDRAGLRQAVSAEWTKLATLRSTKWALLIAFTGTVLVSFLSTNGARHQSRELLPGVRPHQHVARRLRPGVARDRHSQRALHDG